MATHITLVIAHNDRVFRSILQNILQSYAGFCVLAQVDTAESLFEKINELQPDVAVVGLDLNGMDDGPAWEKLSAGCGKTKIIISWRWHHAAKIPELMRNPYAGFVAWDASPADLVYAVKQAVKGIGSYCSQTQILLSKPEQMTGFAQNLDDTWLRMLYCIWMGYSNKDTAIGTELKENTIKSYRKKLKGVTGFRSVGTVEGWLGGIDN